MGKISSSNNNESSLVLNFLSIKPLNIETAAHIIVAKLSLNFVNLDGEHKDKHDANFHRCLASLTSHVLGFYLPTLGNAYGRFFS